MAYNGTGVFNRVHNFVQDRLNSIKPSPERFDAEFQNVADGLSNAITRDGQSTVAAHIPFNGKRIMLLGDPQVDTDALNRQYADGRYLQASQAANAAQIRGNVPDKVLDTDGLWSASEPVALGNLTGTVTPDLSTGVHFTGTLTANITLANPTNPKPGQAGVIYLTQDGTGGRTITWGANYKFEDSTAPLLTTTAAKSTAISYFVVNSTTIITSCIRGL